MGEPAKRGIGRWIFLGCAGCGGLVLLGAAGCAGLFYYLYRQSDAIAAVGAAYLKNAPELKAAFGDPLKVERVPMNWKVQIRNDQGHAHIGYAVKGPKGSSEAVVWLTRSAGAWVAVGARAGSVELGRAPDGFRFNPLDWDD